MMEASDDRNGPDRGATSVRWSCVWNGSPLSKSLVGPHLVEIVAVLAKNMQQLLLAKNDQPVEALATYGPQKAFADGIHKRGLHRRAHDPDAGALRCTIELPGELVVVIANQDLRSDAERRGFADLLRGPLCGRLASDGQMHNLAAMNVD